MAVFNHLRKEIDAKIVYYGPGISGKTSNLQYIHGHLKPDQRGKMVSLATDEDRTLFFDFLPIELQSVRGYKTRIHLYTVPGQVYYGATRRAVLTGVDGVIFVADSQADRVEDNLLSLKDLEDNLRYYGKKIENIPLVIQYNKRDLPNVLPPEELNKKINRLNAPFFDAVAILGKGVFESLTMTCRLVLKAIESGTLNRQAGGAAEPPFAVEPIKPPPAEKGTFPQPSSTAVPAASFTEPAKAGGAPREPQPLRPPLASAPQPASTGWALKLEKEEPPAQVPPAAIRATPEWPGPPAVRWTPEGGLKPEKEMIYPNLRTERVEKEGPRPEAARVAPGTARSAGTEKILPPLYTTRVLDEPAVNPLRESSFVHPEPPRVDRAPRAVNARMEGKKGATRSLLSRVFDKSKAEERSKPEGETGEKGGLQGDGLRILSYGEPCLSAPGSLEVPLTVEVDGLEKSLSIRVQISLNFENKPEGE